MNKFLILVSFIILLRTSAFSYIKGDLSYLGDVPVGTSHIAMYVINEMYVPPSHYSKGDITITASPLYFQVDRLLKTDFSKIDGDGYKGFGFGLSSTYAIADTVVTYVNFTSVYSSGTLVGDHTVDAIDLTWGNPYKMKGESAFDTLFIGFGYDFIEGEYWSMPFFIGFHYIRGVTRMDLEPLSGNTIDPSMTIWSSGSFSNLDFRFVLARKIGTSFVASAYLLYMYSESDNLPLKATVVEPNPDNPIHAKGQSDTIREGISISYFVPGLSLQYKLTQLPLNLFINITGILSLASNWYNDIFFYGLEMKSFMVGVTYSGNIDELL